MNMLYSKNKDEKRRVLILAPHQDDEIDLAAYALLYFKDWDKFILYSTNGDNKTSADIRFREAIESAQVLGVPKHNLVFLGYGDNQDASTCVFYSMEKSVPSAAGHIETYGASGMDDYHFKRHGTHSPYNYSAFKNDLKEVVLDIKADLIICVDFDSHIDHRMLSLAFDEVMCDILSNQSNTYYPEVWKRFGYAMSYFAPEDYTPKNNTENVFPSSESLKPGEYNLIGKSLYQWEDRIRIPAVGNTGLLISSHKIVQALKCHVSQYALFRAFRMDNSDEVFWRKRTDNLALMASVHVSSGVGTVLNDFKVYNTDDISEVACTYKNDTWTPEDDKPSVTFKWDREIDIGSINIYGSIYGNGYRGTIEIIYNEEIVRKSINIENKPEIIILTNPEKTNELTLVFQDGFKGRNGISEIEVFGRSILTSYADQIQLSGKSKNTNKEGNANSMILKVDNAWLIIMRLRSYIINYSRLLLAGGVKAILNKLCSRVRQNNR